MSLNTPFPTVAPEKVHETLKRYILIDGYQFVFDYEKSHGPYVHDSKTGAEYLDLFSFFASQPIGYNHAAMSDPDFEKKLLKVAKVKPSSSDVYTQEYAEFVEQFGKMGIKDNFAHGFFIAGGSLAVENALKAAFDWKVRKNIAEGRGEKGDKVIHFKNAFHGRSGYTLTMTNTYDPRKYMYFPRFDWPRVDVPFAEFPLDGHNLDNTVEREEETIKQIKAAIHKHPYEIAAMIVEPILSEGGDLHLRKEFLQQMRELADENDIMLIFDEVQTGVGLTGSFWAWESIGVKPDMLAFGKKMQICGVLATDRIDSVPENVFREASRINSTWGPDVVDMVRSTQYLRVIDSENLINNANEIGAIMRNNLEKLQQQYPDEVLNVRGRGLLNAFDFRSADYRDKFMKLCFDKHSLMLLGCGERTLRMRPFLDLDSKTAQLVHDKMEAGMKDLLK